MLCDNLGVSRGWTGQLCLSAEVGDYDFNTIHVMCSHQGLHFSLLLRQDPANIMKMQVADPCAMSMNVCLRSHTSTYGIQSAIIFGHSSDYHITLWQIYAVQAAR